MHAMDGCPAVRPDLQYSLTEESAVVLDLDAGEYVALDGVATRIWRAMVGDRNLDRAVETLLTEYDVEEPRLRADIGVFLDQCRARGWLEDAQR
jgi:cell division septum initiation protein DivIVA